MFKVIFLFLFTALVAELSTVAPSILYPTHLQTDVLLTRFPAFFLPGSGGCSRAGQRSPVRLVPALRACACVCVWVTSGPGWRFASPKSKVNPVSGVFFRQPYMVHEEELGFVGRKKKRQLPKQAFKQDISSERIPEIPLSWNVPVAPQPSAAEGAPPLGRAGAGEYVPAALGRAPHHFSPVRGGSSPSL